MFSERLHESTKTEQWGINITSLKETFTSDGHRHNALQSKMQTLYQNEERKTHTGEAMSESVTEIHAQALSHTTQAMLPNALARKILKPTEAMKET